MSFDIVIVGGGFGGLETALTLRGLVGDAGRITLIDQESFHSFIPSIHEISSGKISTRSIQIPLETVLAPAGIRFVRDEVIAIDPLARRVTAAGSTLDYDCLVLATGAENNFFGVPGAEEFSFRFRTPDDAARIRDNLTRLLADGRPGVHLVLAGGGTEGVEVAGELLDLIRDSGSGDNYSPGNVTITVIEAQQQLLPGFPPAAREFAERYLREQGVTVVTGQRITAVSEVSLVLASGGEIAHSMLIWTGGIKPSRLIEGLALPKDPTGWLIVTDQLRSPADERFFGIGDVVTIQGPDGTTLPLQRLAYHAQDQAEVAGINVASFLNGKDPIRYKPRVKPQLISIGKDMGIYTQGNTFKSGAWVVDLKKAVERKHLMSYLTRPLLAGISRKVPGIDMLKRLGLKLRF
jgi:NADH:ubiquinone reductase (H+-translocating)